MHSARAALVTLIVVAGAGAAAAQDPASWLLAHPDHADAAGVARDLIEDAPDEQAADLIDEAVRREATAALGVLPVSADTTAVSESP